MFIWRSVSHPWLLTPKQCVACVSRGIITMRVADWQTNISIPNTGQRNTANQPRPQPATRRMSLFARQIHFFCSQRWVVSDDRGECCECALQNGLCNNMFDVRRTAGIPFHFLTSSQLLSHTLPSNVFYSRHKCWNGRRGEGRRVGGGAERDRDSRGLVSHRAASVWRYLRAQKQRRDGPGEMPLNSILSPSGVSRLLNIPPTDPQT